MEKILVTGAGGLVGHAVCRMLAAAGRPFTAIDVGTGEEEGFRIAAVDVRDVHRLYALADREGPFGAVIHCGALSGPMLARDNPVLVHDINVTGTVNLLEFARVKALRRVVFCSSVSAYGSTPPGLSPVTEDAPLRPSTVYGASKAACEALAHGYALQHGVDTVSLRIGWVYGPRRKTACDLHDMIVAGLKGEVFRRPCGAATMRQYVHVDDIARALLLATDAAATPRRAYTITGDSFLSLPEVAAIVRDCVPSLVADIGPGIDPQEDVQARFDLSAAADELGYRPAVPVEEGIARYADWLRRREEG
ncbi:NAD-dependent epimerase/dehydratase family protein [Labrys monachus]|uniref:Nucleoside-diphosphate-sugar epimerase n=1 Tax=Labrys monachus TaxID=217067 RepID=A0ABU0FFF6_9HYPH|nr:NAD(P)-dependent oxidoreductase [Labrys monachus]MDQ0393340.1 nucleoside-diphosphate-sugar epimerase [Labrys monachus]